MNVLLYLQLFRNFEKGGAHEPVPKVNTCHLALPVPHRVDTKIPVSGPEETCPAGALLVYVPPKVSISNLMGIVKGRTAIRVFKQFPYLKKKLYWGYHFWAPGYCVDPVGLDEEMICKYVKHQEKRARHQEQMELKYR